MSAITVSCSQVHRDLMSAMELKPKINHLPHNKKKIEVTYRTDLNTLCLKTTPTPTKKNNHPRVLQLGQAKLGDLECRAGSCEVQGEGGGE